LLRKKERKNKKGVILRVTKNPDLYTRSFTLFRMTKKNNEKKLSPI
jgi:hypothetical protein